MAGKADVQNHLLTRRDAIGELANQWRDLQLETELRSEIVEDYFNGTKLGIVKRVGSNSIHVSSYGRKEDRRTIAVVGRHGIDELRAQADPAVAGTTLTGPGIASRLGPTVAFTEGVLAARELLDEKPVNLSFLSIGDGDSFFDVGGSQLLGPDLDGIIMTNATAWTPQHPTITTGARGTLTARLSLEAGQPVSDFITSGAVRNPLTTMTQILGRLRDGSGRIALSGFYDRAEPPRADDRAALRSEDYDPDAWTDHLRRSRPQGRLSALERASLWPGVSVLCIETDAHDRATAPGTVIATVAFYLVQNQRPTEVETALRSWFETQAPKDSSPRVKIIAATRPYRSESDSLLVHAQKRAAYHIFGRYPVAVHAGGPATAGDIALATGAPIGFAGVARPSPSLGSLDERLPRPDFETGVAMAAETCLQLRRL